MQINSPFIHKSMREDEGTNRHIYPPTHPYDCGVCFVVSVSVQSLCLWSESLIWLISCKRIESKRLSEWKSETLNDLVFWFRLKKNGSARSLRRRDFWRFQEPESWHHQSPYHRYSYLIVSFLLISCTITYIFIFLPLFLHQLII